MTSRQRELLLAIEEYWREHNQGPSVSDLQKILGVKSRSWVYATMMKLVNRGHCVYLKNQNRSIRPVNG